MADWTIRQSGNWSDASKWNGGVPNAPGATANFTVPGAGAGTALIRFLQNETITVGTLNITSDSDDGWGFFGFTGVTVATLRFQGAGGGPAFLNVDTNNSTGSSAIVNANGMRVSLQSDLIVTTIDSDTVFEIAAPILGSREMYKFGDGTLQLTGDNSAWFGDLLLRGGRTEIVNNAAEGGRVIELDNGAALVGIENFGLTAAIETRGGSSTGVIAAATGTQMQLFGKVSLRSDATAGITFGSATDQGTIILSTGAESIVTGAGGFRIAGGRVLLGSNNSGVTNFFNNVSSSGILEILAGATLDTRGLSARITNLDLDGGTVESSLGSLNVTITDTTPIGNNQSGTIAGTAGADRITVNVSNSFAFFQTSFTGWDSAIDIITINGDDSGVFLGGSTQNDAINGGTGDDILRGFGGVDTIRGGTGNDEYRISDALSTLIENAGEGTDTVEVQSDGPAQFTLAANFENLTFLGSAARLGIGNSAANVITGGTGADRLFGEGGNDTLRGDNGADELDGGIGADQMEGGTGDDRFFVDNAGDSIVELAGQGNDYVRSQVSYTLGASAVVETLSTFDHGAATSINLTGNGLGQDLIGNAGANSLDGGGGADRMIGLGGDDFYIVDDAGDSIIEFANDGRDYVASRISFTLTAGAQVETLSALEQGAVAALNLTGNEFGQDLIGNAGANSLDGAGGADRMIGLGGNDFYFVDNAGDSIIEFADDGSDYVAVRVSYTLTAGAQVETLSTLSQGGTEALDLTGNGFAQDLIGNNGSNLLSGGGGADRLIGLGGDDFYVIDSADDSIVEFAGGGSDYVFARASWTLSAGAEVETVSTEEQGGLAAIDLNGNELANTMIGNNGANILNGRGGADRMVGLGGADAFVFNTALGGGNIDQILDMTVGVDKIVLDDAVFTGLALGALSAGAFNTGTGAADATDRITYNSVTGALFFDSDGVGGAAGVQFAILGTGLALTSADFIVI